MNYKGKEITAVILDLDGVITDTASLHTKAWKEMFDSFLQKRSSGGEFKPFDPVWEYLHYVDGKPRYEGARAFLESRGIELPFGSSQDSPDAETVCGLGNRKNIIYNSLLKSQGAVVFEDTVEMVKKWLSHGIKLAVISASKNCRDVLQSVDMEKYFRVIIDGNDALSLNLRGKPEPDVFVAAAQKLGVSKDTAAIVEDATSGVEAGKKGGFHLTIGVARHNSRPDLLYKSGADIVIATLTELDTEEITERKSPQELPSALNHASTIASRLKESCSTLFIDYDGTLTPIIDSPRAAFLSPSMKNTLKNLSSVFNVAIISGRDLQEVKRLVGISSIYYAGSHGFDISGPEDMRFQLQQAIETLPLLDTTEKALKEELKAIEGVFMERKKFSLAIHYRSVKNDDLSMFQNKIDAQATQTDKLKLTYGKKVIEFKPALDWHKGKAVSWISQKLHQNGCYPLSIYIGDDITDEDALKEVAHNNGIPILVGDHGIPTAARFSLQSPDEVELFLNKLTHYYK
ncbi:trehalose-phosphatase [Chitinispirillales bacterium ANBcel5]|uniref:trehalose-phosphatase n=1 Tax=Cellulosispirillum alkaliphilum TaxID=3039283 RepID=UPI002A56ED37|nr:trehalose-phosphatase [Chitinispirillales bacterium ANBcel5]